MLNPSGLSLASRSWLLLSLVYGVSPAQWLDWLANNDVCIDEVASLTRKNWLSLGLSDTLVNAVIAAADKFNYALNWVAQDNHRHIIDYSHYHYPDLLKQLSSPPLALFVIGDPQLLSQPQVAIVGSRRASRSALDITTEFAEQLSINGVTVTSGMAIGIDGKAHTGALRGAGGTIAVLGTGVDVIYPKRHSNLYHDISKGNGCVISEFALGTGVKRFHFPRRNRLIAALSLGTLVVEAQQKSGSMITARQAADLGRDVFAVPGNIKNPMAQGCHALIQEGAKLVTTVDDIMQELQGIGAVNLSRPVSSTKKSTVENLATDTILDSVELDVTSVDIIADRNNMPVSEVMAVLLEYELRGWVAAVPGGYVNLRGN